MEDAKDIKKQEREKNLYPSLVSWLITKKYFSKDTSTFKKGGQWGNPDVTGIKIINDIFGLERLEVCTIEAKAAATDWKKYIFEAVSHKRFANRAYFAFAIGSDKPSIRDIVDYNEMRDYGEKFKIGIIAIFLQINDFKTLNSVRDLSLGDVDIIEVWPALYEEAKPDSSDKFCREFLGFKNRLDVYNFKSIFDD